MTRTNVEFAKDMWFSFWDIIPVHVKVALFLVFDSLLALRSHELLFFEYKGYPLSFLIHGDPLWLIQFLQFVLSSLYVLNFFISKQTGWLLGISLMLSPFALFGVLGLAFESLFLGNSGSASVTIDVYSTVFTSLFWAAQYLSIAIGLTLIYKVQRFGNFAQAETMLIGAYIGITLMWSPYFSVMIGDDKYLYSSVPRDQVLTWDLLFWSCVAAFFITGFFGVIIDRLVYRRFRQKNAVPQIMMIASLGVSMIIRAILYLRYRAVNYRFVVDSDWIDLKEAKFKIPSKTLRFRFGDRLDSEGTLLAFYETVETDYYLQYTKAAMIIGIFAVVFLTLIFLNVTKLGRQMRAVADNPDLAASSGINVEKVHAQTAFLAAGLSGMCGVLLSLFVRINPNLGLSILLPSFAVIVLGTLGSLRGAVIASIIVGVVRTTSESILIGVGPELGRSSYSAFGEAMPYMFLVAVLLVLPKGIGDAIEKWRIERIKKREKAKLENFSTFISRLLIPRLPEFPWIKTKLRSLDVSQRFLIFVACLVQFVVIDLLDIYTSGKGTLYYTIDFVYLLLKFVSLVGIYSVLVCSLYNLKTVDYKELRPPELPFIKDKLRSFDSSRRGLFFLVGVLQILLFSVLDIFTTGKGLLYYAIDLVYVLLELMGLVMIYSSIAAYYDEIRSFLRNTYAQVHNFTSNQKRTFFTYGLSVFFLFYIVDYFVYGFGFFYLFLDLVLLILQISGILMTLYSSFFLKDDVKSIYHRFINTLRNLPESNKFLIWFTSIIGTLNLFLYMYLPKTSTSTSFAFIFQTSGSGFMLYIIDLFLLICLFFVFTMTVLTHKIFRVEIHHRLNLNLIYVFVLLLYFASYIDPQSRMYIKSISILFLFASFNDLNRFVSKSCILMNNYLRDHTLSQKWANFSKYLHSLDERKKWAFLSVQLLIIYFSLSIVYSLLNKLLVLVVLLVPSGDSILAFEEPLYLMAELLFVSILFSILYLTIINSRMEIDRRVNPSFGMLSILLWYFSVNLPLQGQEIPLWLFSLIFASKDILTQISHINFVSKAKTFWNSQAPYGRSSEKGSWFSFVIFFLILCFITLKLPSVSNLTRVLLLSRIITLVCIFSILAFSLNLHTGLTGMTNFGVIFFAGLGAITVGLLTVPENKPGGHGWSPLPALLFAMLITAAAGWFLAYPTARLRMDYFAIVTISLGEMLRIAMRAEPLLRAGTGTTAIGIQLYDLPFKDWWEATFDDSIGEFLSLDQAAPYTLFLSFISVILFLVTWVILGIMMQSPWGRILRAIREDEEVTMHHGHSVFYQKAGSLALGGAIAAVGGALWAWMQMSILDDFLSPVRTTFLIWAAFIIGGKGNNRGMIIGAFVIVIVEFVFNLMVLGRGDPDNEFYTMVSAVDGAFSWLVLDVMSIFASDLSVSLIFGDNPDNVIAELAYVKVALIGLIIVVNLLISEKGLLPEVPNRPVDPDLNNSKTKNTSEDAI